MKKVVVLMFSVLLLHIAYAHEENVVDPGITPDSFFWGLDKALDNLNMLLTFDHAEKAKKGLEISRERLEEIKVMIENNKLEAAEKSKEAQVKVLSKIKASISKIKEENSTKQIEEEIEMEREIEEHEEEIKEARNNLKIKIEVRGTLNEQQKELIGSILSALENKTGEIKIEIKNKKDKTKIEIKQKTGKSEEEIEEDIQEIEEEKGLAEIQKERAIEEIEDAKEDLIDLEAELEEHKAEGHVQDEAPITVLINNSKEKLEKADEAFEAGKFGEAFGQANAAHQLIENAERILEKTVERFEGEDEEDETEEKREIEIEIEEGEANIKIEIKGEKLRFVMDTTDKSAITQEIADRTGLSIDEVTELAEFEDENTNNAEIERDNKKEEKSNIEIEE